MLPVGAARARSLVPSRPPCPSRGGGGSGPVPLARAPLGAGGGAGGAGVAALVTLPLLATPLAPIEVGALVGGASLDPKSFAAIVKY